MKIICIGRNYIEHAKELGNEVPEDPVIFLKPDTALLKEQDFYLPEFSQEIHYELEVVLKISKNGKYIQPAFAHQHFEEIGLGIDFTARDLQQKLKQKGLPWELAKAFDHSAAISAFFPKKDFDLANLNFHLEKNAEICQRGNTSQMLFSPEHILSFASQYFTLKTGDLVFTGTPSGVGKISGKDVLKGYLAGQKILEVHIH